MRKNEVKTTPRETKAAQELPEKYDVLPAAVTLKTAAQYVRGRLGIGFEVIDLRLDKALAELRLGVEDVQVLIEELSASKSAKKAVQIQQKLAENPFFSDCDLNFSFENDIHIPRFRYWYEQSKQSTTFEKLKFKVPVLDAWWAANSPSPQATPAHKTATLSSAVASDPPSTVIRIQAKRRTWRDVALPYMFGVFKDGQYTTAKEFYQALEKKAGIDSPFERGTGMNRDSLFVREISGNLSFKTVQNVFWKEIKGSR